ncbi:hypothetical protein MRX96_008007 [Rhipicephalus microplus]
MPMFKNVTIVIGVSSSRGSTGRVRESGRSALKGKGQPGTPFAYTDREHGPAEEERRSKLPLIILVALLLLLLLGVVFFMMSKESSSKESLYSADEFVDSPQGGVIGEVLKGKPKQMCFLGIFNATDGKSLVSTAKQAVTDFPAITMIILQVHHAKAAAPTSTFPIAPNPDTANLKDHGVITLNDIKDHIGDLKDIPKKGTYLLISIAMFGRAYLLKYNNKLDLSNSSMVVDYGVVCACKGTCKRSKDPSDPSGSTTFDVRNNTAVDFYDGPDSIHEKTTARLNILPHNYTGIAAYSVEMDDFYQICDDTKFKRLISIKTKITELTKSGDE